MEDLLLIMFYSLKIFYSLGSSLDMLCIMKWAKWLFTTAVVNVAVILLLWKQEKNLVLHHSGWEVLKVIVTGLYFEQLLVICFLAHKESNKSVTLKNQVVT